MNGELFGRPPTRVAPGAVHLPDRLDPAAQRELLAACRRWARPPAGLRTVRLPGGGEMSVRQFSLGWHWYPYGYARTAVDGDGAPVKPFPEWLGRWARDAVAEAYGREPGTAPRGVRSGPPPDVPCDGPYGEVPYDVPRDGPYDVPCDIPYDIPYDTALVNFYGEQARMGMHQDRDERSGAPVVSFSLGDTCVFRFGNTACRGRPWTDVELRSGDVFVFGGPARRAHHGVPRTRPGTSPPGLHLRGRVSVTVRAR